MAASIIFAILAVALYFTPAIVVFARRLPHSGSVIVIDVFLGWTLIGWVVALAMACRSKPAVPFTQLTPITPQQYGRHRS
jgi:Superinfection immunity protein